MTALGGRVGLDPPASRRIYTQQGHQTNAPEGETVTQRRMHAAGLLLSVLLSVEFVLYIVSLCSSKWLVLEQNGASQGLFSVCHLHNGLSACYKLPPWVGAYSLSWMFLAGSSILSLAALVAFRLRGPAVVLLFNISSATLCVAALIVFLLSLDEQLPKLLEYLGWTFYICCGNLLYTVVLSVALGLFHGGSVQVEPAHAWAGVDLPVMVT